MTRNLHRFAWPAIFSTTAVATALAYYSLRIEPFLLEVTATDIPLRRLPPAWEGLTILFLADTHTAYWGQREQKMLEAVRQLSQPDLIIWGGDFLRGQRGIPATLQLVRHIAACFPEVPTFAVLGNAEHKQRVFERNKFIAQLNAHGVQVLLNEHRPLTLRGETIHLVGVDDPYYGFADLEAALSGLTPPIAERFTLLLAHSPQIATQAARRGIDLMLSGHTHGGQVRLPVIGPLKTQNPLCRRLDCGLFDARRLRRTLGFDPGGSLTTYISRGIGLANVPRLDWLAPRFLCRPEIAVLTLRSAPEQEAGSGEWGTGDESFAPVAVGELPGNLSELEAFANKLDEEEFSEADLKTFLRLFGGMLSREERAELERAFAEMEK